MSILAENIRKTMRISHNAVDSEIEKNIDACLADLRRAGVNTKIDSSLIDKACELYCKWQQDYQEKSEQYKKNYNELRDSMSLSGGYRDV